jgi:hypothetical protein
VNGEFRKTASAGKGTRDGLSAARQRCCRLDSHLSVV